MPDSESGLVSVIIPVHNGRRWIHRAVASALAQTYSRIEIIVVDDGSTDATAESVRSSYPGVRVCSQSNRGAAAARNLGARAARGEFLAFLDADDVWSPAKLAAQFAAVQAFPNWGLCVAKGCKFLPGEAPGGLVEHVKTGPVRLIEHLSLLRANTIWTSSTLLKRQVFLECSGFDESLRRAEDHDLWLKIAKSYDVVELDVVYIGYQITPGSLARDVLAQEIARLEVISRWKETCPEIVPSLMHKRRLSLTRKMLRAGRTAEAKEIYINPAYGGNRRQPAPLGFLFWRCVCALHRLWRRSS